MSKSLWSSLSDLTTTQVVSVFLRRGYMASSKLYVHGMKSSVSSSLHMDLKDHLRIPMCTSVTKKDTSFSGYTLTMVFFVVHRKLGQDHE